MDTSVQFSNLPDIVSLQAEDIKVFDPLRVFKNWQWTDFIVVEI